MALKKTGKYGKCSSGAGGDRRVMANVIIAKYSVELLQFQVASLTHAVRLEKRDLIAGMG